MKPDYKQISEFIDQSLDLDYLAEATENAGQLTPRRSKRSTSKIRTGHEAFVALKHVYLSEYGHEVARSKNYQQTFASYLMGLPSCVNIPFSNYEILQLSVKWESLPVEYTEKQADNILENYWSFMAMQYSKEARKHGVDLLR